MKKERIFNVIAVLVFVGALVSTICLLTGNFIAFAEEEPPVVEEPQEVTPPVEEVPSEEPQADPSENVPEELQGHIKRLMWFLDDELYSMLISALGVLFGVLAVVLPIVKKAKTLKELASELGGKKDEMDKALNQLGELSKRFEDYVGELEKKMNSQEQEVEAIKEMCKIAFTNNADLIANGGAEEITKISEGKKDEFESET